MTDLEKELQDFDIDADNDDVSHPENGSAVSQDTFEKAAEEKEVNMFK